MLLFHWRKKQKAKILNDLSSYISAEKDKAEKNKPAESNLDSKTEKTDITPSIGTDIRYKMDENHYRKRLSDDHKPNPDVRKNLSDNYADLETSDDLANDHKSSDKNYDFLIDMFSKPKMTVSKYIIFFIDKHYLNDADVYKRANLSRQYFNSVMNDRIRIGKEKALALCIGLKLDINEATVFLRAAGYAFSPIEVDDLVYKYSIEHKIYNINFIKELIIEYSNKTNK